MFFRLYVWLCFNKNKALSLVVLYNLNHILDFIILLLPYEQNIKLDLQIF